MAAGTRFCPCSVTRSCLPLALLSSLRTALDISPRVSAGPGGRPGVRPGEQPAQGRPVQTRSWGLPAGGDGGPPPAPGGGAGAHPVPGQHADLGAPVSRGCPVCSRYFGCESSCGNRQKPRPPVLPSTVGVSGLWVRAVGASVRVHMWICIYHAAVWLLLSGDKYNKSLAPKRPRVSW